MIWDVTNGSQYTECFKGIQQAVLKMEIENFKEDLDVDEKTLAPSEKLKSLDESNQEAIDKRRRGMSNGIACPLCGEELTDIVSSRRRSTSLDPDTVLVICMACSWKGERYI